MKKLLKYLKPYTKECIIAPAFKMLEALFELYVPLVMTKIIDDGIKAGSKSVVYKNGGVLVLLGLIGLVCALIAQYFAAKAAIGFSKALRNSLYERILGFSYESLEKEGTSSLITRMTNDINTLQNGVNMVLRLFLRSPFIVFGSMIMAFTISVKAALIFVVVIPVLFLVVLSITLITIPLYKKIQKYLDALTSHIRENLTGARVIRAFSKNAEEEKEFRKDNDKFYSLSLLTGRISTLLNPLTLIIVNVGMVVLLSTSAFEVNSGNLTNGMVYALVNYMSQILIELVKLSNLFITINRSLASASRIEETLETKETLLDEGKLLTKDLNKNFDNLISFKDVSFTYPNASDASLKNISIDIKEGETIGIIGATGSGKTSILNLLMRFYDASLGEILYKGENIKNITLSSIRREFSVVPQKAELFSGKLRENLSLGYIDASDEEMIEALKLSEAYDFVKDKGKGLDLEIREGGSNLSGGQKQRLCIARALVKKSPVLIMDDSFSALDYKTDAKLRENLKTLKKTIIIISQRIISTRHADKIIVLDDGSIDSIGTHEELLKTSSLYREICESQKTEGASL